MQWCQVDYLGRSHAAPTAPIPLLVSIQSTFGDRSQLASNITQYHTDSHVSEEHLSLPSVIQTQLGFCHQCSSEPGLLKLVDMQLAWGSSSSARSCNRMAVTGGKHAWYRKPYRPYTSPLSSTGATSRPERLAQAPKREQSQHTTRNKILLQGMDEHTFWQHLQVHHHPASFPRLTSSQLVACFLAAICARLWLRASGTGCRQAASAVFTHMFPASPGG